MILRWKGGTTLPVESAFFQPVVFPRGARGGAEKVAVHVGNEEACVGDVFGVEDDGEETLTFEGDLSHVRGIGRGMAGGKVVVRGTAGPYLGAGMTGGTV